MNIRIKKECIDWSKKRELKQWHFTIKTDRKWKVYVLTLPSNITLEGFSNLPDTFLLMAKSGRHLGNIFYNPFSLDGALLTFAP